MLCAKFGWNWPRSYREEAGNVKTLQTDRQKEAGQKSLRGLLAQVSENKTVNHLISSSKLLDLFF